MKRTILTIIIAATAALGAMAQTEIDFDYKKQFEVSQLWFDYNGNEEIDDDETYDMHGDCTAIVDFRDFGSAGNHFNIYLYVGQPGSDKMKFKCMIEDVLFIAGSKDGKMNYVVINKLKELQIVLMQDGDRFELYMFCPEILEEI